MIGLCHNCYSSNIKLSLVDGVPVCIKCKPIPKTRKKEFDPCTRCKTPLCYSTKECLIQVMRIDKN